MVDPAHVVFLCTGNAARSVMAALMLADRDGRFRVSGAGTHAIEGLPMSRRTRVALEAFGLADPDHRSRQLTDPLASEAAVLIAFEPDHVRYVRRHHPASAVRTATLRRLVRDLPAGPEDLAGRVSSLSLQSVELEEWEEVVDPAGGDDETFAACARAVSDLVDELRRRL